MADAPPPVPPLLFLEGEADGFCDAETGVCAVPPPEPGPDAEPEPGLGVPSGQSRSGSPAAR